ncbi:N-acetyltransferase family protein [Cupriavidus sp. TMH.W2]|uniref:GNAT family N-acetyltransferase n=1 Tax=Cupriavidus sp. TMH.W2 TaxID=3434465 RepID=UPI003D7869BD
MPSQDDLTIRLATKADAAAISAVLALCWHQAYGELLPRDLLANVTAESRLPARHRILADSSVACFVATGEAEVVGFADCGPSRGAEQEGWGEVYALYVLQSFHGRRVGLRLMSCCAAALARRGCSSMRLWSLEENARARKFYESAGGRLVDRRSSARGSMVLTEVEYHWDLIGMERLAAVLPVPSQ